VATIMLLASLLESAPDVGPDSRERARQLLGEARWLDQLQRAYDRTLSDFEEQALPAEPIRLDLFAADVVRATKLSSSTVISFVPEQAWARAEPLAFWRALRNIVGNGIRAAGPDGRVDVRIESTSDWVVIQVDDDGPGFGAMPTGSDSLGLDILQRLVADWGGCLEIGRSALGGCRVLLSIRAEWPSGPGGSGEESHASADL